MPFQKGNHGRPCFETDRRCGSARASANNSRAQAPRAHEEAAAGEIGEMSRSIDLYPDFRGAVEQMINSHCGHDPEAIKRAMIVKVVIDPANAVCIGERKMPAVAAE
jgi:hypothetical protein